jgi:hypothetical protein
MAVELDVFNPQISTVSKGLDGKSFLVYGSNRTGKTKVGCELPKPFYLGFENGISAISGIPFLPINNWSNFLKIVKQLTKPDAIDKVKEMYQTIIFDTLEAAARFCEEYTCSKYGAETIASGNKGYGLWKEFSIELWKPLNQLTSCGLTTYFIAHDDTREVPDANGEKTKKIYPRGEKRLVDPAVDLCDFIIYLQPNGLDENGKEILSSAYCTNTREYHAGSRFTFMPEKIEVFSAENLQKVVEYVVEKEEEFKHIKAISFKEQKNKTVAVSKTFSDLTSEIKAIALKLKEEGMMDKYKIIVEQYLGKDGSVKDASPLQAQQLELILDDLKDLIG